MDKARSSIQLIRDSGWVDRRRAYSIILDGQAVTDILDGETREWPVSPGPHELSVRIDWCATRPLEFEVAEGQTVVFQIQSNLRGWRVFLGFWYAFIARHSYLILEAQR